MSNFLEAVVASSEKEQTSAFKFDPGEESEEISSYFTHIVGECLAISIKEASLFIIKDGEYMAQLLIRGYKNSSDQANIGLLFNRLKIDFKTLLLIALEYKNERQILISLLGRLSYGFVSKHDTINEKCTEFFVEVFKRTGIHYKKHLDYDSETDLEYSRSSNNRHTANSNMSKISEKENLKYD